MAAIGLTLADVADDATRNLRTKRLPLVGVDNAVDDFVLVFRVLKADMKRVGYGLALEDAVAAEASIEVEKVAEVIVTKRLLTDGCKLPVPFFAKEAVVANRSVVEVDALQADDGVLFQFLVVLGTHLGYVSIQGCEVFARQESKLELRVEVLEQLGGSLGMLKRQRHCGAFLSQGPAVKIGEEEVVEDAVECRRALFIYAKFLLHLCKRIDRNSVRQQQVHLFLIGVAAFAATRII